MNKPLRPVILGQFGPPTLACIRSWGRQGFMPGMICVSSPGEKSPKSRYLRGHTMLPKEKLHTEEGIEHIAKFLHSFQADGLICISERTACWLQDQKHRLPGDTDLWLPPKDVIQNVLSKEQQIQAAREAGMNVLPTYLIQSPDFDISAIKAGHYPLCLRPSGRITPKFKVSLVESVQELRSFLQKVTRLQGTIIAQPFKNLPNIVIHGARTRDRRILHLQSFLVERKFEGVTLTIRPYTVPSAIMDQCSIFAQHMNLVGPFHFEFLFQPDTKDCHFLEVNNRLGGTTSKVLSCGYDEPLLTLAAYESAIISIQLLRNVTVSNKISLIKFLASDLKKKLTLMDYPQESHITRIFKTIICIALCKDEVISFNDIKGTFDFYIKILKNNIL